MGFATDLLAGKAALLADPKGREWYDLVQQGKSGRAALDMIGLFSQGKFPPALLYAPGTRPYRDAWQETIDAAEQYNDPGRFTAVIGYEWTSLVKGGNMHRNGIFRDNGDLSDAPKDKVPSFLVAALNDPIGANLDRIQIIKGWRDAKGALQEKVYDVAWGGDRKPDAKGKLPSVGSTVDLENASWTDTIGAGELITVWTDPDFDARQRAFYYARVIEIPTPRWTAYDVERFGSKPLPGTRMTVTERAYTSPIWYTPKTQ